MKAWSDIDNIRASNILLVECSQKVFDNIKHLWFFHKTPLREINSQVHSAQEERITQRAKLRPKGPDLQKLPKSS